MKQKVKDAIAEEIIKLANKKTVHEVQQKVDTNYSMFTNTPYFGDNN